MRLGNSTEKNHKTLNMLFRKNYKNFKKLLILAKRNYKKVNQ